MKKKLIAIVLSVLLVVSAVLVLAACQPEEPVKDEYTVTFRHQAGRAYFTVETVNKKLDKTTVENEFKKIAVPKDGEEEMSFFGWYGKVDQNDKGKYLFEEPINWDKTYSADAEYYAYWHVGAGLPNGYTVIGQINGVANWDVGTEPDAWKLTQDTDEPWIYRVDLTIKGGDQIKVKEKTESGWDPPACNCNLGMWGLQEVILADGITLPKGYEAMATDKTKSLTSVFYGDPSEAGKNTENVLVGANVETAKITVEYDYSDKQFRIYVNELTLKKDVKITWVVAGNFGKEGDPSWWNKDNTDSKYILTAVAGQTDKFEITFTFEANAQFKIANNVNVWIGYDAEKVTVKADTGVGSVADLLANADGNIKVTKACTAKITFDASTNSIEFLVTSLTPAA